MFYEVNATHSCVAEPQVHLQAECGQRRENELVTKSDDFFSDALLPTTQHKASQCPSSSLGSCSRLQGAEQAESSGLGIAWPHASAGQILPPTPALAPQLPNSLGSQTEMRLSQPMWPPGNLPHHMFSNLKGSQQGH